MDELTHDQLRSVDERLGSDFQFDYEQSVELRCASGGTSRSSVQEQIDTLKELVA